MSSAAGKTDVTADNMFYRQKINSSDMEDNCTMPSLQDILKNFDASQLEELAENLLADVITDLADDAIGSFKTDAKNVGTTERLSESMVGTETENMESPKNFDDCIKASSTHNVHIKIEPKLEIHDTAMSTVTPTNDSETLYGTYDESSYCITVVLPNENIPICEAVEEIVSSEDEHISDVSLLSPIQNDYPPSPEYSLCNSSLDVVDVKSPLSICSNNESGYESIPSPLPPSTDINGDDICDLQLDDELWNNSFTELFPSLF